jgi:hypothetical protein
MNVDEVIEMYIDDTVRLLPRRQREDVAAELRGLLNEELSTRAQESGRPADLALALSLVRGYGPPNEVAARYHPAWTIIDSADTKSFVRAATIGAAALALLSALRRRLPPMPADPDDLVALPILAWLGLLAVSFGVKSWVRRRWPTKALWKPREHERPNQIGTAIVVPIATLCVILYAAPTWVFDQISGGRFNTSWTAYAADVQRWRLPLFIGLLIGLLAVLSFAAIRGRWSRLTRRLSIGLNFVLAGLVLYLAMSGNIFQSSAVDQLARRVLALVAVVYVPSVGVQIYGEIGRVDRAALMKGV